MFVCLNCRASFPECSPSKACENCFAYALVQRELDEEDVPVRRRAGVIQSNALAPSGQSAWFGPPWDQWKLGLPFALMLCGEPGCGKSTASAMMAVDAARTVSTLIVSAEEGFSGPLGNRLSRARKACGIEADSGLLHLSDAKTPLEAERDIVAVNPLLVIVDSVSELGCSPRWIVDVLAGRNFILVAHANVKGRAKHGGDFEHLVDCIADVDKGRARIRKNRFGGHAEIEIFAKQASQGPEQPSVALNGEARNGKAKQARDS